MSKAPDTPAQAAHDRESTPQATLERFESMLSVYRETGLQFEEPDGSFNLWPDLSPEGKLAHLARDAAAAGVAFEHFAAAARDALSGVAPEAREAAALKLALGQQRELEGLEALLPPDGRTESTPLVERFREALDLATQAVPSDQEAARERAWQQIAVLKGRDDRTSTLREELGEGMVGFRTVDLGPWASWPEPAKLFAMQNWVNWEGVDPFDKELLFRHEVDFSRIPPAVQQEITGAVWPVDAFPWSPQAAQPDPPSPGDIASGLTGLVPHDAGPAAGLPKERSQDRGRA